MAEPKVGGDVKAAFWFGIALLVVAALIDDGTVAWLLSPLFMGALLFAAARAPLRHSLMALMFTALVLDYPNESLANGLYHSPFFKIGWGMMGHLNNLTGVGFMAFAGTDVFIGVLIAVAYARESGGSRIDRAGRVVTPRPLIRLAQVAMVGIVYVWLSGLIRGGHFGMSLWQVERVIHLPVLFLLFHLALRGPQDQVVLGKVILAAAIIRALLALYVVRTVVAPIDPDTGLAVLPYATSHSDSMLFATAFVILVLLVVERASSRAKWLALVVLPVLIAGMVANNRRLVWVHVGLILLTLYLSTPDNPVKRKVRRLVYAGIPAFLVYLAAGWNSQTGIFKPVRTIRSVVEPSTDGSSLWRELENYNLIFTLKQTPILGAGYGHRFIEVIPLPMVAYDLEYYCPHNSLLGLWAFAGYFGYTAITLMWGAGVYFAMRAYHASKRPIDRVTAIVCVGAVIVYMVQCFGDLGLGSWTGIYILAPALALAGKLAVATGTWGAARSAAKTERPAASSFPTGTAPVEGRS